MDAGWLITVAAAGGSALTYIVKKVVDHLLGRGQIRIDEAAKIRIELRGEIDRKDKEIAALKRRLDSLEQELEKAERERNALDVHFSKYRLDVYRTLVDAGVDRDLLNTVLAIQ